jgi:hypothetical protein
MVYNGETGSYPVHLGRYLIQYKKSYKRWHE